MVGGLVIWVQLQMNDTCLNLASIIRKIMITQSKKLRGSVSFVSLSSLFHPRGQLILRLCSWSQNGHRSGLHVGIPLVHIAVGERGKKKRERKRRKGKTERREAIFPPAQWILNPFFQSTETI